MSRETGWGGGGLPDYDGRHIVNVDFGRVWDFRGYEIMRRSETNIFLLEMLSFAWFADLKMPT